MVCKSLAVKSGHRITVGEYPVHCQSIIVRKGDCFLTMSVGHNCKESNLQVWTFNCKEAMYVS
jgi:hypothetical protein